MMGRELIDSSLDEIQHRLGDHSNSAHAATAGFCKILSEQEFDAKTADQVSSQLENWSTGVRIEKRQTLLRNTAEAIRMQKP